MPDGRDAIAIELVDGIDEIPATEWDACAEQDAPDRSPFVSHAFLKALEDADCVTRETGWLPKHLAVKDADGRLIGAAPLYVKGHSQGEYVFDWGWADAFERAGGRYYPKLQAAVPFTPVTGPRLLIRPGQDRARIGQAIGAGMAEITRRLDVSSLHVTFAREAEVETLSDCGFLVRHGHQYHWFNRGYESFDDFLAQLTSRKRKDIAKERRRVRESGISLRAIPGAEMTDGDWDAFFQFYVDTYDRKWGYPYLTREFFELLSERMPNQVVVMMAYIDGEPIAGALNFVGGDAIYGRNWGCIADYKFLHFEACYYMAIDYAIEHGLKRVEAGTQGPHKLRRGYEPVQTQSAHWIADPGFRDAVARYLERERSAEAMERVELADFMPYRRSGG